MNTQNIIHQNEAVLALNLPVNIFTRTLEAPSSSPSLNAVSLDLQLQLWTRPEKQEFMKVGARDQAFIRTSNIQSHRSAFTPVRVDGCYNNLHENSFDKESVRSNGELTNTTHTSEVQIYPRHYKETVTSVIPSLNHNFTDSTYNNECDSSSSSGDSLKQSRCTTSKSKVLNQYPHEVVSRIDNKSGKSNKWFI